MQIELGVRAEGQTGVDEQQDVFGFRTAPGLRQRLIVERRVRAYPLRAIVDQRLSVGTLMPPGKALVAGVFEAQIGEAVVAQRHAQIAFHLVSLLILVELPIMRPNLAAFSGVFHLKVDHPGNGVGAVLGGGAVAQHFHIFQGDAGDHADVGPVGAFAGAGDKLGDQRGPVPAFAVDQHQGLVRGQPPQGGGANEGVLIP